MFLLKFINKILVKLRKEILKEMYKCKTKYIKQIIIIIIIKN